LENMAHFLTAPQRRRSGFETIESRERVLE
jgi:hypothetical protein